MFCMARPVRGRINPHTILPLLATIAILSLLGHFVADAANLWAGSTAPAASNAGFQHPGGGRQDAASTVHTGFAVAMVVAAAAPAVLSMIQIWSHPQQQFRLYAPPFLPPKSH